MGRDFMNRNSEKKHIVFIYMRNLAAVIAVILFINIFNVSLQNIIFSEALPVLQENKTLAYADTEKLYLSFDDIIFQEETDLNFPESMSVPEISIDIDSLRDFNNLKSMYIIDKRTGMTEELFNADEFMNTDLKINKNIPGPKVLIFHTHSQEAFADSNMLFGLNEGIIGVGALLCKVLEEDYGIECIHHQGIYDVVDGKTHILGAYERMEPSVSQILKDNPSIQLAIDLHRDGVKENIHLVTEIDGKPTAQIMFFNGLSMLNTENGLEKLSSLPNPYIKENLALSFNLQLTANSLYPGFTRKIYLNAYRYSLHMLPKSALIEIGAQTNTKEEAFNAVYPLAKIISLVVL